MLLGRDGAFTPRQLAGGLGEREDGRLLQRLIVLFGHFQSRTLLIPFHFRKMFTTYLMVSFANRLFRTLRSENTPPRHVSSPRSKISNSTFFTPLLFSLLSFSSSTTTSRVLSSLPSPGIGLSSLCLPLFVDRRGFPPEPLTLPHFSVQFNLVSFLVEFSPIRIYEFKRSVTTFSSIRLHIIFTEKYHRHLLSVREMCPIKNEETSRKSTFCRQVAHF